jgi:hypothetical protein
MKSHKCKFHRSYIAAEFRGRDLITYMGLNIFQSPLIPTFNMPRVWRSLRFLYVDIKTLELSK